MNADRFGLFWVLKTRLYFETINKGETTSHDQMAIESE